MAMAFSEVQGGMRDNRCRQLVSLRGLYRNLCRRIYIDRLTLKWVALDEAERLQDLIETPSLHVGMT